MAYNLHSNERPLNLKVRACRPLQGLQTLTCRGLQALTDLYYADWLFLAFAGMPIGMGLVLGICFH